MKDTLGEVVYGAARRAFLACPARWRYRLYEALYVRAITRYPKVMHLRPQTSDWGIGRREGLTSLKREGKELLLDPKNAMTVLDEWPIWEKYLLPSFPLEGKTVLDVGAAGGDTAFFYFTHGAKQVVGVEADPRRCKIFKLNAERLGWDARIICEPFSARHLSIPHDFLKVDCDGGETALLEVDSIKPSAMELHPWIVGQGTVDQIVSKFKMSHLDSYLWASR